MTDSFTLSIVCSMDYIGREQVGKAYEITPSDYNFESFIKKHSKTFSNKIIAVYQGSYLQHFTKIDSQGKFIWILSLDQKKQEAVLKSFHSDFDYYYNNGRYHQTHKHGSREYPPEEIKTPYSKFIMEALAIVRSDIKNPFNEEKPKLKEEDIAMDKFVKTRSGLYVKK